MADIDMKVAPNTKALMLSDSTFIKPPFDLAGERQNYQTDWKKNATRGENQNSRKPTRPLKSPYTEFREVTERNAARDKHDDGSCKANQCHKPLLLRAASRDGKPHNGGVDRPSARHCAP